MKITSGKISQFLSNFDEKLIGVLFYGPDTGAVSSNSKKISLKIVQDLEDPFNVVNLDEERILEEQGLVADEFNSISFGGGRRLIRIKNSSGKKDIAEAVKLVLQSLKQDSYKDAFLLVTAEDLSATSPVRKLFEAEKQLASVACYPEEGRNLSQTINRLSAEKNLSLGQGVVEYLNEHCRGDSNLIKNEVEKLYLYKSLGDNEENSRHEVELEDVLYATGNSSETNLQDLCNLILNMDAHKSGQIQYILKDGLNSGLQPIAIIRTLQRYFEKLHYALDEYNTGNTIDGAVSGLRPPVFFKQVPIFKRDLLTLSRRDESLLFDIYEKLIYAEKELKETGAEPELISSRLIFDIFSMLGRNNKRAA